MCGRGSAINPAPETEKTYDPSACFPAWVGPVGITFSQEAEESDTSALVAGERDGRGIGAVAETGPVARFGCANPAFWGPAAKYCCGGAVQAAPVMRAQSAAYLV